MIPSKPNPIHVLLRFPQLGHGRAEPPRFHVSPHLLQQYFGKNDPFLIIPHQIDLNARL